MAQLSELVERVRRNLQEFKQLTQSELFYENSSIQSWIGEAYRYYVNLMIDKGEGYFETTVDLPITANVETVSIASLVPAFKNISNVYKRVTTGIVPLKRNEFRYKAVSNIGVGGFDTYIPDYNLRGLNIVLYPTPRASEAASPTSGLRLDYNYVPDFPDVNSPDTFEFNEDFNIIYEPMITLYATISALESKDGMGGVSDIQSFRDRLSKWEGYFLDSLRTDEASDQVTYFGLDYSNPFSWERV